MICKWILPLLMLPHTLLAANLKETVAYLIDQSYLSILDNDYKKSLKIWFISNTINEQVSPESLNGIKIPTWLAIDKLDLCPSGMPYDPSGQGITPIVLHNYLVRHFRRDVRQKELPDHSLDTFKRQRQVRPIHYHSILSADEIQTYQPFRSYCSAVSQLMRLSPSAHLEMSHDQMAANTLQDLIEQAKAEANVPQSLASYLTYRSKLIDLYLAQEGSRELDEEKDEEEVYDSEWEVSFLNLIDLDETSWHNLPGTDKEVILTLISRLRTISPEKKNLLYNRFLQFEVDKAPSDLLYPIIGYISEGQASMDFVLSESVERINATAAAHKFEDSGAFYGRLGVRAVRQKNALLALEYFSKALRASQSINYSEYSTLSMSWIKYVMLQYRFDDRLLKFLNTYLSKAAYNSLVQSLAWSASFYGEPFVFRKKDSDLLSSVSASNRKLINKIRFLALNQHDSFIRELREQADQSARSFVKFAKELTDELATESLPIIRRNANVLHQMQILLNEVSKKHKRRNLSEQVSKVNVEIDRLLRPFIKETTEAADRRIANGNPIPLGGIFMEPTGTWPWPFPIPIASEVFIFRPISLSVEKVESGFSLTLSNEASNL